MSATSGPDGESEQAEPAATGGASPPAAPRGGLTGRGRWVALAAATAFLAAVGGVVALYLGGDDRAALPAAAAPPAATETGPAVAPGTVTAPGTGAVETGAAETAPSAPLAAPGVPMAFASNRDGDFDVYLMETDGAVTPLTTNGSDDRSPALSPDGASVAFQSDPDGDGAYDVYTVHVDGTGLFQVTADAADDGSPSWSPDGSRIAFQSNRDGDYEIFVANADGSGVAQLTSNGTFDSRPAFAPDADLVRIAFDADPDGDGSSDVFVMLGDGSGIARVTQGVDAGYASWSPDGSRLAFEGESDGNTDVWVVGADGGGQAQLTFEPGFDGGPHWLADGRLAFHSDRNGVENWDVFVMNADGTGLAQATDDPAQDAQPSFAVPASGSAQTPAGGEGEGAAEAALLAHVPDPIRGTCTTDTQPPSATVAGVVCRGEGGVLAAYWLFESAATLDDWYGLWLSSFGVRRGHGGDCATDAVSEARYSANGAHAGRFACAAGGRGRIVVWEHRGLAVGALATRAGAGRAARRALFEFWTGAGPF